MRIPDWLTGPQGLALATIVFALLLLHGVNKPYVIPMGEIVGSPIPGTDFKPSIQLETAEQLRSFIGDGSHPADPFANTMLRNRYVWLLLFAVATLATAGLLAYRYRSDPRFRAQAQAELEPWRAHRVLLAAGAGLLGGLLIGDALAYFPFRVIAPDSWINPPGIPSAYFHYQFDFKELFVGLLVAGAAGAAVYHLSSGPQQRRQVRCVLPVLLGALCPLLGLQQLTDAYWFTANEDVIVTTEDSGMGLLTVRARYFRELEAISRDGVVRPTFEMVPGTFQLGERIPAGYGKSPREVLEGMTSEKVSLPPSYTPSAEN